MKSVEIKYYDNGNKEFEIEYLDGKKHGRFQDWHEDGQRYGDSNWEHGERHGRFQDWWSDGQRWEDSNWEHGKKHGRFQMWRMDGQRGEDDYYIHGDICSKAEWEEHNFPKPECDLTNCSDDVLIDELKRRLK